MIVILVGFSLKNGKLDLCVFFAVRCGCLPTMQLYDDTADSTISFISNGMQLILKSAKSDQKDRHNSIGGKMTMERIGARLDLVSQMPFEI